jgi:hypothetical protein
MELAGVASSIEDFCARVRGSLENATFEQKRQLVELLIDRVIVTDSEVEIRYVIPTSPSSENVSNVTCVADIVQCSRSVRMDGIRPGETRVQSPN